ncbi:uncharacterized protein LOC131230549 [Magnolia sinica]|uniref:uncharacterized protein LOC131230549 n=1 Tax=Magnolia sinica TaxID=86752 RepID=UPI002659D267|nr:uncharacterized protein LOC131230549 [Magnolia sinica]
MAVICHQMAKERNLTSDVEIGRHDVYLRAHTSKDKVVQYPDLVEKLDDLYSNNPSSKITGVDDALTQLVSSDSKGRMRGLGCSITKTGLKMSAPARSKVENLIKERDGLVQEIFDIKKSLPKMESWMELQQHAQSTQNLSSPTIAKSAQASSDDENDINDLTGCHAPNSETGLTKFPLAEPGADSLRKWLGNRQIRCNWVAKGAGFAEEKPQSENENQNMVVLTNGSSGSSHVWRPCCELKLTSNWAVKRVAAGL